MGWVLLIMVLYFIYKTYKDWLTLSKNDIKIYGNGNFSSVKSKEEIEAGCISENYESHNKNY